MDAPNPIRPALTEFLLAMPAARRWSIAAGGIAVLVLVVALQWTSRHQQRVAVFNGGAFTQSEAEAATRELAAAGLSDFTLEEGRILVPSGGRERYESVLSRAREAASGRIDRWHEADSLLAQFADGRQQQARRDEARARLISDLLAQLPDVDHAEIVWDEEPRVGWRRPPRVRATVYLQPKADRAISMETVNAVRLAVASSKAHLDAADVVVMDLARMVTYAGTGPADAPLEEDRAARQSAAIRSRIESALSDIAGVRVSVVQPEPTAAEQWHVGMPAVHAATECDPSTISPLLSLSNMGLEVPSEPACTGPAVDIELPSVVMTGQTSGGSESREVASLNIVVRVPAAYVQQQVASKIAPGARVASAESGRLVAEIEENIRNSVRRRVSEVIGGGRDAAATIVVETEPVQFAAMAPEAAPSSNSWLIAAIGGPDARSWSMWAVVFGFGASLCWWLRDVIEWHAQRNQPIADGRASPESNRPPASAGTVSETALSAAAQVFPAGASAAWENDEPSTAVPGHAVTIQSLLERDPALIRRLYTMHPVSVWATALRGETDAVVSRLLGILDASHSAELRRAVRAQRPVRLREIEDAQTSILADWSAALDHAA